MAEVCVLERIAGSIYQALCGASELAWAEPIVQRPTRLGMPDAPKHHTIMLVQGDPTEDTDAPHGFKAWVQPFHVVCFIRPSDTDTTPIDTYCNAMRASVERLLRADPTWGGLAQDTIIKAPTAFDLGDGYEGVQVNCDVHYRTRENDPFTLT